MEHTISSNSLNNYISSFNTTNKILKANGIFIGEYEQVINYSNIILNIKSDVNSKINGVIIEFSNLINILEFKYEYTYKNYEIFIIQIPITTKYFRIKYINDETNQTNFNLFTTLISGSKIASNSDGLFDAFDRLRVSNVKTLMDITHTFDNGLLIEDENFTLTATSEYNQNQSCQITTINNLFDYVIRQSRKFCVYQPGKSLLIKFSCVLNAAPGGNSYYSICNVGYYNESNGYFFRYRKNKIEIVYRTKATGEVVNKVIEQSKWNLNTLSSMSNGYILNPSRVQIYFIDLQWLGVGRVRMGVVHNGKYIFCHEFLHDNILDKVYISNANLPIRHEMGTINSNISGTNYKAQCKLICSSIISEGGYNPVGITFSASRDITPKQISNIEIPLISIQLKSTRNRTNIIPTNINLFNTGNSLSIYYVRLFRAPTNPLTNPTWISVHPNSAIEYDINSTNINITNSINVAQGYFIGKSDFQTNINDIFSEFVQLTSNIDGISDILVISAKSIGTNQDIFASIQWKEIF